MVGVPVQRELDKVKGVRMLLTSSIAWSCYKPKLAAMSARDRAGQHGPRGSILPCTHAQQLRPKPEQKALPVSLGFALGATAPPRRSLIEVDVVDG